MISRKYIVTGKVQGVWFRESTRRVAAELGINGYAINRPDGSVEVLAQGEAAAIERLEAWLREGPPMARVDDVHATKGPTEPVIGFETRITRP